MGYRDITTKRSIGLTRNQANTLERVRNQEQQINTLLKKKVISAQAGRSIKRQLSKEGVKEFTGRIEESKRGRGLSRIEGWINRERQKQLTAPYIVYVYAIAPHRESRRLPPRPFYSLLH